MKSQKKEERQKYIWKRIAIAVTAVFALLLIVGVMKAFYIKSSLIKPTQVQMDYATKIAAGRLQSSGANTSTFQIHVGERMHKVHDKFNDNKMDNKKSARTIIQVSFYNNSVSHTYLIDVNSGEIILHTETDLYGALASYKTYNHRNSDDSFHPRMEYPGFFG